MEEQLLYETTLRQLTPFIGKSGLYIIKPKNTILLQSMCEKLGYTYRSGVAYIGKGAKKSDLFKRSKQEMGWSNFDGATFVKKVGLYLDYDIKDKKNKQLREEVKKFICSNFTITCHEFPDKINLLTKETEYINSYKPCLNVKKNY